MVGVVASQTFPSVFLAIVLKIFAHQANLGKVAKAQKFALPWSGKHMSARVV